MFGSHLYGPFMNLLFESYASSCAMRIALSCPSGQSRQRRLEGGMVPIAVMTVLCTAAITFYVRFLIALFRECKPLVMGYWVRLRLGSDGDEMAELHEREQRLNRAA